MTGTAGENNHRFSDSLKRLCCFGEQILVRCPACQGCAQIISLPAGAWDRCKWRDQTRRRLSCLRCGHTRAWTAPRTYDGVAVVPEPSGPIEPFFGLPLWLQTDCCGGHTLWCYNTAHLDVLEAYLAAPLRQRGEWLGSMSMIERLPAWLKSAKHREEALHAIRRMRLSADLPNIRT